MLYGRYNNIDIPKMYNDQIQIEWDEQQRNKRKKIRQQNNMIRARVRNVEGDHKGNNSMSGNWVLYYYYYIRGLRVFRRCEDVARDRNTRGTNSIDYRERGSHARGVHLTQDTSRMETSKGEGRGRSRYKNNGKRVVWNMEGRNVGTISGEKSQTRPN